MGSDSWLQDARLPRYVKLQVQKYLIKTLTEITQVMVAHKTNSSRIAVNETEWTWWKLSNLFHRVHSWTLLQSSLTIGRNTATREPHGDCTNFNWTLKLLSQCYDEGRGVNRLYRLVGFGLLSMVGGGRAMGKNNASSCFSSGADDALNHDKGFTLSV